MSAANAKNTEPSMEEILASIRRIISDDQGGGENAQPQASEVSQDTFDHFSVSSTPHVEQAPVSSQSSVDDLFDSFDAETETDVVDELDFREADDLMNDPVQEAQQDYEEVQQDEELELVSPLEPEPVFSPKSFAQPDYPEPPRRSFSDERLISSNTDHSVSNAFNALAHTILTNNGRTLEDLVSDMMRPMLKNWLDDNLPTIVERLVRSEIERVARGGRG